MTEVAAAAAAYVDEVLALFENVSTAVGQQWKEMSGEGSFLDTVSAFVRAVDWTEPWLIALMCFHAGMLALAVFTRQSNTSQITLFFTGFVGVYIAERMNTVLDRHWKSFARQPYFDRNGVFLSTVWSVPLLLMTTLILVNSLFMLKGLLIKWKRAELRYRIRASLQKERKAD